MKEFHKNPPPNWLQTWSQIMSVVLAIVALVLTIYISNQQQDVKDMHKVLEELVKQNSKMDKQIDAQSQQIEKLNELSARSLSMIEGLQSVQGILTTQNTTLRINSEPKIQLNGNFNFKKISEQIYAHSIEVVNSGTRTAKDWECWITIFTYDLKKLTFLRDVYCFKSDLNPHNVNTIWDTVLVAPNEDFKKMISGLGYRFESKYYDPLTQKPIITKEYFRHSIDDNGTLLTLFFDDNYKNWIDQLIDGQRKKKR